MKRLLVLVVAQIFIGGCGGGAGGGDGGGANTSPSGTPSATVNVAFPNLFIENGQQVLPAYISHIISSSQYPLAAVTLTNTGPAATMQVSIDLPNYGSPTTQTVSLAQTETKTVTISPAISYTQLFANTTTLPATINVAVTAGTTSVFQQSYPIQITGRDTVFWAFPDGRAATNLVVTMVTPQDKSLAIQTLLRNSANGFVGGKSLVGYQSASWPTAAYLVSAGTFIHEDFQVLQGESPAVLIDSVTTALGADTSFSVYIFDDANYQAFVAGGSFAACASNVMPTPGAVLACTTPAPGRYHIVYLNPSSNTISRTVTRDRPMTKWEVTYYQTEAIFNQLRAQGLAYVNLTGSGFFATAQNVRYPAESLAVQSANCIDGSLVFASAWEAMGMEPILAVDLAHGHAFVAVRCWAGSTSCVIPVETTMVGGSNTFGDAVNYAGSNWNAWLADSTLTTVDIKAARAAGLTPAPM